MQDKTSTSGRDPIRPEDQADDQHPRPEDARPGVAPDEPDPAAEPVSPHGGAAAEPELDPAADPAATVATSDPTDTTGEARVDPLNPTETPVGLSAAPGAAPLEPAQEDEHYEEEPAGRSFASKVLIVLLLLIAGGALALWGAPRLAPHLPSGMAPVATWLAPGQNAAEARIAAVEAETSAAINDLRGNLGSLRDSIPDVSGIETQISDLQTSLGQRIDALSQDLAAVQGTDGGERLAELESAVEGQSATLASLRDQISSADNVEGVTAQIDVYQSDLEGLRAEVRELTGQIGSLQGRLEQVSAAAERQVSLAQEQVSQIQEQSAAALGTAEREAALAQMRSALAAGLPYAEATEALAQDPDLTLPDGLAAAAESGVPTLATLRDAFPEAAHAAIRAGIMARAGDGIVERARAFAQAQVASRSLTPQPGGDPDAILSRMEAALHQDDLATALSEAEALPGEAAAAMQPWLDQARALAAAVEGYQTLDSQLSATN
jgi:hypothetical protein